MGKFFYAMGVSLGILALLVRTVAPIAIPAMIMYVILILLGD